ncbi:YczE/YyaS/YitT family protein [Bacillus solimangrovi]|uniref:YitT family protein n=1 Tax=Bacillus solimangrovi TaxID=1305675 RepID=A0A1E5LE77_9BACI|nr:hypothetical protein [Bacillus solimangrovi]OEH92388.1 hypothetical protein BFG57_16230 [Bacillus solimangrovi]
MRLSWLKVNFYTIGILILTLGIALTIQSQLGTSPFDALLVGLYRTVGLTVGSWEIIVGAIMVLGNALAERKRPEYLALLTSLITGIGIDFWLFVLRDFVHPDILVWKVVWFTIGMIISAIGIATYLQANFAPIPMDRSMLVLRNKTGWSFAVSRTVVSVGLLIFAFIFNGPIGIGTLLIATLSGPLINMCIPYADILEKNLTKQKECISG